MRFLGKKIRANGFVLALLAAMFVAWLMPEYGSKEGFWTLGTLANYGISLIFFSYGLSLSVSKLKSGIAHWRLHLLVHFCTFAVFPLLTLGVWTLFPDLFTPIIWIGVFFMATLPSTVTSSVVAVVIAKGNVPTAIFNASISGLIGIFVVPLWMSAIVGQSAEHENIDLFSVIGQLLLKTLLPVIIGSMLHPYFGDFALRHKKRLLRFDQMIVVLIVYTSFSRTFSDGAAAALQSRTLFLLAFGLISLFAAVYGLIYTLSRMCRFHRDDRIVALFCGSKKSLAHGAAMSKVLFANHATFGSSLGLLLLPLLLYHAMQLIIVSAIAAKYGEKTP